MRYYVVFGLLSIAMGGSVWFLLNASTTWPPHLAWLVAWSVAAFVVYGLDKGLARAKGARVPELILNLLAASGGFLGAWLGMLVFRHKSNLRRHLVIWMVLLLSTAGHAFLIYYWLIKR